MKNISRLFNCVYCHRQTVICSCCDRGHIYCGINCSSLYRKNSLKAAGRRYQNSRRGKLKHAERQKNYRQRQREKEKVTHQGSINFPNGVLLHVELNAPELPSAQTRIPSIQCHFCRNECSEFMRSGFMRGRSRFETRKSSSWPLGP